ncbi:hypothetical protein BC567DRAFT_219558 [Phyllosticta citribraziliensis]
MSSPHRARWLRPLAERHDLHVFMDDESGPLQRGVEGRQDKGDYARARRHQAVPDE